MRNCPFTVHPYSTKDVEASLVQLSPRVDNLYAPRNFRFRQNLESVQPCTVFTSIHMYLCADQSFWIKSLRTAIENIFRKVTIRYPTKV